MGILFWPTSCNQIQEAQKKTNPEAMVFIPPTCIEGAEIPEFEAASLEGVMISKERLKGKPGILNFWFTSCPPCIAEIPGFNAIVDKYGADQKYYLSIGLDSEEVIREFLQNHPWKFDHIPDGADLIHDTFKIRWGFPLLINCL